VSIRRADARLAELGEQLEQPREAVVATVLGDDRRVVGERREVPARAEDLSCVEAMTTQRVSSSSRASSSASRRSSSSSSDRALRLSGSSR
jgi:hypothetical protein